MRSLMKYIVPAILIFAVIGLSRELLVNPLGLLTRILMIAGFIALFFFIYRWVMAKRYGTSILPSQSGPSRSQIRKAQRTSSKYEKTPTSFITRKKQQKAKPKPPVRFPKQKKDNTHLTVIEGKKNKKKNRALF